MRLIPTTVARHVGICAALVLPALAVPAQAAPITFEFEAKVRLVGDPGTLLGGAVATGERQRIRCGEQRLRARISAISTNVK
jgi:hypothetical protein